MSNFSLSRVEVLAKRRGISFREAAALCGRKGARKRRERQCACLADAPAAPVKQLWYLRDNE